MVIPRPMGTSFIFIAILLVSLAEAVVGQGVLKLAENERSNSIRSPRKLAVGDFAIVNEVFRDSEFPIEIEGDPILINAGIGTIALTIDNLICRKIALGDVLLSYEHPTPTFIDFYLEVIQFDTECTFDFTYDSPLADGGASAALFTNDNFVNLHLLLSQSDVAVPPDGFVIDGCVAGIEIINIEIQGGGIVGFILNIIEPVLRTTIANAIESFACESVVNLDEPVLELLGNLSDFISPFLEPVTAVDPLGPERAFNKTQLDSSITLIDFLDPKGSIAFTVDVLLEEAGRILGREESDPESPTGTGRDLGVNVLMRDFLLDDGRSLTVNTRGIDLLGSDSMTETADAITEVDFRIEQVTIQGLDTFTRFDPFQKLGQHTLQGSFAWDYTILDVDLYVALGPPDRDEKVEERISVSIRLDDLEFVFAIFLAINQESLEGLKIGDLLELEEIIPCFFSTAEAANLSSLVLSIGTISDPVIENNGSPGLARLANTAIDGLYELLDELIVTAIPGLFQTALKDLFNDEIAKMLDASECDPVQASSETELVDFRDLFLPLSKAKQMGGTGTKPYGDVGVLLRTLIDEQLVVVDPETGRPKINKALIVPLTGLQSGTDGTLAFNATMFEFAGNFSVGNLMADALIRASDLRFDNLDTISDPIVFLEPSNRSGQELDNNAGIGLDARPVRASARLLIELESADVKIHDEVNISLNVVEARASVTLLAKMLAPRLLSFPLRDILDLNCWLATVPAPLLSTKGLRLDGIERTAGFAETLVNFEELFLSVTCIECTSASIFEVAELVQTEQGAADTTKAANALLEYVTSLLDGEFIQVFIDRAINEAPARCPHNPAYDPDFQGLEFEPFTRVDGSDDSITLVLAVGIVVIGILLAAVIVGFVVRWIVRRRQRWWLGTIPSPQIYRIYREQKKEDEKELFLKQATSSMFTSRDIPASVRYMIPIVILGNIGLFLSGHLSIGGAVNIFIEFAGEEIVIENVFEFSVAKISVQLWKAGGVALAIMILIFSGIWPYTKQLITLVAWFLPPDRLSVSRRGSIFIWLDALAKWSSVDIFFLVVSLVAFNISVESPQASFLPNDLYSFELVMVLQWGLYSNLIAQLLSQISSHVIIYYHRKVAHDALVRSGHEELEASSEDTEDNNKTVKISSPVVRVSASAPPDKLHKHNFLRPHRGIKDKLTIRPGVNIFIIATAVALVALILVGCSLPSFSVEQLGVLGLAIELGRNFEEAKTDYSVFGITKTLIDQGRLVGTARAGIGMTVIAMLVILTVLIVPLIQIGTLVYQWFIPVNETRRGRIEVFLEILSSWQYVEVYLIAVMVSTWQLGPTSEYLINTYCEGLTDTFGSLVYFGILSEDDAQCFRLRGTVEGGCFALIAAAFLLAFLNAFVTRAVFQYQQDKADEDQHEQGPLVVPDNMTQHFAATMEVEEAIEKIHPTPVLFSDTFRWLLDSRPLSAAQNIEGESVDSKNDVVQVSSENLHDYPLAPSLPTLVAMSSPLVTTTAIPPHKP